MRLNRTADAFVAKMGVVMNMPGKEFAVLGEKHSDTEH